MILVSCFTRFYQVLFYAKVFGNLSIFGNTVTARSLPGYVVAQSFATCGCRYIPVLISVTTRVYRHCLV